MKRTKGGKGFANAISNQWQPQINAIVRIFIKCLCASRPATPLAGHLEGKVLAHTSPRKDAHPATR